MSIWPESYSLAKVGVTQTLLLEASLCPVRAALMADCWVPVSKMKTTMFGSLTHDLLEAAYAQKLPPSPAQVDKWIEQFHKKNKADIDLCMKVEEWEWLATKAYVVFVAYVKFYAADWKENKYVSLESVQQAQWNDWLLRGKLDGIFRAKDKSRWLLENKTMSRVDEDSLWSRVSFDTQCQWYLFLYELATGERLNGAVYNVIRNPSHRSRDSLEAALAKQPEHFFLRGEVVFTEADRQAFLNDIEGQLMELEMRVSGCLATYRNTASCDKPFKCGYLGWCASRSTEGLVQTKTIFPELS